MKKSKWIKSESPDDPIEEVARVVLAARLDQVWHYLPAAANGPKSETENVHQLRVWSRRAAAAMTIFADLLPRRHARWINKQLKRVRRAAGAARDLDVLADHVAELNASDQHARYRFLLDEIKSRRQDAQRPIVEIHAKLARKDFRKRQARLIKHTRLRSDAEIERKPTYAQAGRESLTPIVQQFLTAASADFVDHEALHAFRIEGKRLRYAMEVFAGAFSPEFRKDLYKQIERLQEKLGDINDHFNARQQFIDLLPTINDAEAADSLRELISGEDRAITDSRQEFLNWWTPERREYLRRGFEQILSTEVAAASE